MDCIKKKVNEELRAGWIGPNTGCDYHPSHFEGQDCTFCYCPFYPCEDTDLGDFLVGRRGNTLWNCSDCLFIHRTPVVKYVLSEIERLGITEAGDPRFRDILASAKERFFRPGRALMVVGATSDAGKSVTVAAICRILHRRGFLVAPFKSQNMSLNSKVTRSGSEIAMIQTLQARAAGLKNPDAHMNPILLKPKGDTTSQVMVLGKPYADYNVTDYYGEFVPGPGREIVRENVDFLKKRYDYVIMEGAGSPAEINIYDRDIANMGAAEIADADVVLVVNVEWGGSFAYALGTIELIPERDRGRIKGVIFNNLRGRSESFRSAIPEFERISGVPVIGVIPHADVVLPSEDSEALRGIRGKGEGKCLVGVVKFPRIANFTDLDPLFLDICGGYQMMGSRLEDPEGLEGGVPGTVVEGLGFFDNVTRFGEYSKRIVNNTAELLVGDGGEVTGYELHMGMTDVGERPLLRLDNRFTGGPAEEGSVREDEMLFGTYQHGIFDKMPFRRYFLSFVSHDGERPDISDVRDYDDIIDENLDKLADVFEENMDMDALMGILGVSQ